ncbi:tetratricopeptide repeat protein [Nocardia sp. NPDC004604]|uniref:tetratricopeptide repeat protein n=1 Tax=Nocardia sp. NPDC004604 TaxID=3157013 RepID=UPI0033A7251F
MGGRLALIVGSECAALPRLGFPGELATELYANLSAAGGWQPATAQLGPVLDPTADELTEAVNDAFAAASEQQATLLFGFVGHGVATADEDFFLLAHEGLAIAPERAISELERLLADHLRVVGPDDPSTLQTRHSIAYWLGKSGDLDRAIAEFEQVAIDRERILGPDHVDTLTTRSNIAANRGGRDMQQALTENEQLLADQERILGSDHPDTRTTRDRVLFVQQQIRFRHKQLGPDSPESNPSQ